MQSNFFLFGFNPVLHRSVKTEKWVKTFYVKVRHQSLPRDAVIMISPCCVGSQHLRESRKHLASSWVVLPCLCSHQGVKQKPKKNPPKSTNRLVGPCWRNVRIFYLSYHLLLQKLSEGSLTCLAQITVYCCCDIHQLLWYDERWQHWASHWDAFIPCGCMMCLLGSAASALPRGAAVRSCSSVCTPPFLYSHYKHSQWISEHHKALTRLLLRKPRHVWWELLLEALLQLSGTSALPPPQPLNVKLALALLHSECHEVGFVYGFCVKTSSFSSFAFFPLHSLFPAPP